MFSFQRKRKRKILYITRFSLQGKFSLRGYCTISIVSFSVLSFANLPYSEMSSTDTESEESKLTTQQEALQEVALLLLQGFGLIIVIYLISTLTCLRSRKSCFDAIAARRVSYFLKALVICALFIQLPLLYCYIVYGSPVTLSEKDETYYMTFGWLRPVAVIVFLCFGLFADMHAGPRYICLIGAIIGFFFDAVSAVRVYLYYYQVRDHDAPTGLYNQSLLRYYFYRDVASFCLAMYIALLTLHLSAVVGWCQPPVINYQSIVGGEVDRLSVFRQQRHIRRMFDYKNAMEEKRENEKAMRRFQKEDRRARRKLNADNGVEQNNSDAVV